MALCAQEPVPAHRLAKRLRDSPRLHVYDKYDCSYLDSQPHSMTGPQQPELACATDACVQMHDFVGDGARLVYYSGTQMPVGGWMHPCRCAIGANPGPRPSIFSSCCQGSVARSGRITTLITTCIYLASVHWAGWGMADQGGALTPLRFPARKRVESTAVNTTTRPAATSRRLCRSWTAYTCLSAWGEDVSVCRR